MQRISVASAWPWAGTSGDREEGIRMVTSYAEQGPRRQPQPPSIVAYVFFYVCSAQTLVGSHHREDPSTLDTFCNWHCVNGVLLEGVVWDIIIQISWQGGPVNYTCVYAMDLEAESLSRTREFSGAGLFWVTNHDWLLFFFFFSWWNLMRELSRALIRMLFLSWGFHPHDRIASPKSPKVITWTIYSLFTYWTLILKAFSCSLSGEGI